ncbi:hypothetical protein FOL47_004971 [Perkinsus chesapeaki]|uniref:Amino acid transporter transmembrane domain-containing protein n=1 Tax=Perkinsus chesapeaki TaxID=330153 RepID=A0A7J6N008_PERCH|nr:hypothetical protein FOL47_004971 [Perkinsus chesapeaki]
MTSFDEKDIIDVEPNSLNLRDSTYRLSKPPSGTVFTCWTALSKTMIGTGMLALAYGFSKCGWILGFFLLAFAGGGAVFTLHLLGVLAMHSPTRRVTFFTVAEECAPWSKWIVDVAIAVKCIGVGISYIQVSSDTISSTIGLWSGNAISKTLLRDITVIVLVIIISPICLSKSISRTMIVNILGLVSVAYVVILSVCLVEVGAPTHWGVPHSSSFMSVLAVFPTFIFAFTCHQNVFLCAEDLNERTQKKLDIIAFCSEAAALCWFVPAIIFPYITFGASVQSNFVLSYDDTSVVVQIAYLLLGIAEVCAFPLQALPARKSLLVLILRDKVISPKMELYSRIAVGTALLLLTVAVAISVKSLGYTLSFVGIIGSNTITFIMPTFLYCMTLHKAGLPKGTKWFMSAGLCVIGLLLVPLCLSSLIYEIASR